MTFLSLDLWLLTHPYHKESHSPGPLPAFCQYDQKRVDRFNEQVFQSIYIQFQQRVEDQRSIKRTHWRMIESKWPLAIGGKWLPLWSAGPNAAEDGKTWLASPPWITYWAPTRSLDILDTQTREIIWKNLMLSNTSWDAFVGQVQWIDIIIVCSVKSFLRWCMMCDDHTFAHHHFPKCDIQAKSELHGSLGSRGGEPVCDTPDVIHPGTLCTLLLFS